jgi:uncharacterized iron-regulated membrane protein
MRGLQAGGSKADAMSRRMAWRRWVANPQSAQWRQALLKVHLWTGLAAGIYIVVISLSGSAVVFRREVSRWFMPPDHAFGDPLPTVIRLMEWCVDLHDNLLAGATGRVVNGVGGFVLMLLALTGLVLWWPGRTRWRRSLIVPRPGRTRRFSWHLHSALGLWSFALLFGWAATGIYFGFPEPFEATFNRLSDGVTYPRPGEAVLLELIRLHFGRFGGLGIRVSWVVLGLIPVALFVTGFIVWWQRRSPKAAGRPRRAT